MYIYMNTCVYMAKYKQYSCIATLCFLLIATQISCCGQTNEGPLKPLQSGSWHFWRQMPRPVSTTKYMLLCLWEAPLFKQKRL